jgi:hypothetical protein
MLLLEPPEHVYDAGAAARAVPVAPVVPADIAPMSARTANVAQNLFIAHTPLHDF